MPFLIFEIGAHESALVVWVHADALVDADGPATHGLSFHVGAVDSAVAACADVVVVGDVFISAFAYYGSGIGHAVDCFHKGVADTVVYRAVLDVFPDDTAYNAVSLFCHNLSGVDRAKNLPNVPGGYTADQAFAFNAAMETAIYSTFVPADNAACDSLKPAITVMFDRSIRFCIDFSTVIACNATNQVIPTDGHIMSFGYVAHRDVAMILSCYGTGILAAGKR